VESADRESRRLDILSVKKEANLSPNYSHTSVSNCRVPSHRNYHEF